MTMDSFYFGTEIDITKQISYFLKRIWWEFLKIGRKYQAAGWSSSYFFVNIHRMQ